MNIGSWLKQILIRRNPTPHSLTTATVNGRQHVPVADRSHTYKEDLSMTAHLLHRPCLKESHMMKLARRFKDLGIEGKKARQYDEFSRGYRMGDFTEYARLAARHVEEGGSVLDVATGPGYFCTELARLGHFKIIGLDISTDLVDIEAYANVSLKKYKPIAALNESRNVFKGRR
jgi:2-polyprenyl-3-methyl-5-hydroxy-6-metoxy-1,4-benzoquinol methylase